jgi:predicted nucleotidyltransferase
MSFRETCKFAQALGISWLHYSFEENRSLGARDWENSKMSASTISQTIIDNAAPVLAADKDIVAAYLFGSVARGREREGSDVDIAILLDERQGKPDRKAILDRLLPALGRALRKDVHLLILNDASYLARMEVFAKGRLICVRDERELAVFRMVSFSLFAEFAPWLRSMQQKLKQRLVQGHGE